MLAIAEFAQSGEEILHFVAERAGLGGQGGCGAPDLGRGLAVAADRAFHPFHALRHVGGIAGDQLDTARDFLGRGGLLHDGGGDGHGDFVDLAHRAGNPLDGLGGAHGRRLDGADLTADLLGCLRSLRCQRFYFRGDDGKALARIAGTRRLDGGIECQQIGLAGDAADQFDDRADLFGGGAQFGDLGDNLFRLLHCLGRNPP